MNALQLATPSGISKFKKGLVFTKNYIEKQSPVLLAGSAVVGVFTVAYLASKDTIKANEVVKKKKIEVERELSMAEKVEAAWKCYIPTAISVGLTVTAIIASCAISQKRQAALAGLYALSETALKEYQDKVEAKYGPNKEQAVRDSVNSKYAEDVPVDEFLTNDITDEEVASTPGIVWVKDKFTGRMFKSTIERIRQAANTMNESILGGDMCSSYNDFYSELGLACFEFGDETGWNMGNLCRPYFTSALTSNMRPIVVLDWDRNGRPRGDYREI